MYFVPKVKRRHKIQFWKHWHWNRGDNGTHPPTLERQRDKNRWTERAREGEIETRRVGECLLNLCIAQYAAGSVLNKSITKVTKIAQLVDVWQRCEMQQV